MGKDAMLLKKVWRKTDEIRLLNLLYSCIISQHTHIFKYVQSLSFVGWFYHVFKTVFFNALTWNLKFINAKQAKLVHLFKVQKEM